MRRTHRISWMVSGWIESVYLDEGEGGTAALTLGCADDFYAVRLGFPNVMNTPWRLSKVIGTASAAYGDYVNPSGTPDWTPFTFAMGGADDDRIVTREDAPSEISVKPSYRDPSTGDEGEPVWTWTDWTPIASKAPDPETGMRVLMVRAFIPPRQTICYAVGQFRSILGNRNLNCGFENFIGGIKFDHDRVNDPSRGPNDVTTTWIDNQLVAGSVFPIVQFLTRNAGVVGMSAGDSHQQGTTTTEQFTGFLYRTTTSFGGQHIGRTPFGMVNCAVGGARSGQFFSRLANLLPSVRPSYVVLPGWTFNDEVGGVHSDLNQTQKFTARLLASIELCRTYGCLPVCLTPLPRDSESMTPTQLEPWLALRSIITGRLGYDISVLDGGAILGAQNGALLSGTYRHEFTDDGRHPDDRGHAALGEALKLILTQHLFKA